MHSTSLKKCIHTPWPFVISTLTSSTARILILHKQTHSHQGKAPPPKLHSHSQGKSIHTHSLIHSLAFRHQHVNLVHHPQRHTQTNAYTPAHSPSPPPRKMHSLTPRPFAFRHKHVNLVHHPRRHTQTNAYTPAHSPCPPPKTHSHSLLGLLSSARRSRPPPAASYTFSCCRCCRR